MSSSPAASSGEPPSAFSRLRRLLRGLVATLATVIVLALVSWGSLALAIDGPGRLAAAVFLGLSLGAALVGRKWKRARLVALAPFVLVLGWWWTLAPSNERPWLPDVARLPEFELEGDRLRVRNLRHFLYRSDEDFDERWEEREYDLASVRGLDLAVCDWGATGIVHTFLSWEFAEGPHLAISIETRKEQGESYSAVRGFFRQYELYYAAADERDVLAVRTNVRGERVRLYRLDAPPEEARALLELYARRITALAREPAWYNALSHNCTTSIRLHVLELGTARPWDWRLLVNGFGEKLLYERGQVNTTLAFEELRARSDVTAAANAAGTAQDFSARIRAGLPARPVHASQQGTRSGEAAGQR